MAGLASTTARRDATGGGAHVLLSGPPGFVARCATEGGSPMRAAVMRQSKLVVDTLPDPEPGPGEVLVKTLACGICGSDLHALRHADKMVEAARESGVPFAMDPQRDVVMGHEFC